MRLYLDDDVQFKMSPSSQFWRLPILRHDPPISCNTSTYLAIDHSGERSMIRLDAPTPAHMQEVRYLKAMLCRVDYRGSARRSWPYGARHVRRS